MVFNGWLVLTSRPGLYCSSAHMRSHVKNQPCRHPPTDSLLEAHTPRSPHPSSGGFWQLFMLLNWLSHYSWNITRLGEKDSRRFLKKGRKNSESAKERQEQSEDKIGICPNAYALHSGTQNQHTSRLCSGEQEFTSKAEFPLVLNIVLWKKISCVLKKKKAFVTVSWIPLKNVVIPIAQQIVVATFTRRGQTENG